MKENLPMTHTCQTDTVIYPVILPVPCENRQLSGRKQVEYLSRYARYALSLSAEKKQIRMDIANLPKDAAGAPLPADGLCWSVTHKPEYVAGVVSCERIGLDIEKIRPVSECLFRKISDEHEANLTDDDRLMVFFRYWTSKEAVLKAAGTGLKALSRCKIMQISDEHHLIINFENREWLIEHCRFDGHIASVVKNTARVKWSFRGFVPATQLI